MTALRLDLFGDFRQAARRLARTPGFAALSVLTLALGIGSHAAIVGWADATFLEPLPVPGPDRLVGLYETRGGAGFFPLSLPDADDYRERTTVFSGLAAHYPVAPLVFDPGDGSREEILGSVVSPDYFPVLGLAPERGRFFTPDEAGPPGAHPVAVVSHRFQHDRRLGPGAVITLNDTAFTVVGVAPERFHGVRLGFEPEVYLPTSMAAVGYRWCDPADRGCTFVEMIGRLAPGRTLAEARAEMTPLSRRVNEAHPPAPPAGEGASGGEARGLALAPLVGIHPASRAGALRLAGLLGLAATLVLLVAATNLGGLLVARDVTRRREIATRLAIGAARWRVVRESLAETALIAAAGGAGGLLVAAWLGRAVVALLPGGGALGASAAPTVLGWAALLSLATGLVLGLATGVRSSRPSLAPALAHDASQGGGRRPRSLGVLLVAQVALSFVLLTSAGLLVRSLANAHRLGGARPERVATLRMRPQLVGYPAERARPVTREALARLAALPGVEAVTVGRVLPPWGGLDAPPSEPAVVEVGPGFFEIFGVRVVRGRGIEAGDREGGEPVAVVGRAAARERWGDDDPLDRLLDLGGRRFRVVGVADDPGLRSVTQVAPALVYTAYEQDPGLVDTRLAVRTSGDAEALLPVLARTVHEVDPAVPLTEVETLADRLDALLGPVHAAQRMIGACAAIALVLSAIGLYGNLALAVAQGRRDIGIRMALGGSRRRVVARVVGSALTQVALALGIGLVAALFAGRALAHHLYEIGPRDPLVLLGGVAAFALVAVLSSWWPARRAARVDPATALRR